MTATTATRTLPRGIWTAAAALEEIQRRDPWAVRTGPDGAPPATCPRPTLAERLAPIAQLRQRCPDCGAFGGVDNIRAGYPPETHPEMGPCPLPTAPRDRYASESLRRYLRYVEGWYQLRGVLRPGDTIYTILRRVAPSGMHRRISCVTIEGGSVFYLDGYAANALDENLSDRAEGIPVSGAGMDMGYHLVDRLSWAIYGRGYALRHRWI